MNTLLAILKVTDAKRDVILAGELYHRFPWRHLPPNPPNPPCLGFIFIRNGESYEQYNYETVIYWPSVKGSQPTNWF